MIQLCTYIRTPDGVRVQCEVLEHGIPSPTTIFPLMLVRGISERLNPINRVIVPMANLFSTKVAVKS